MNLLNGLTITQCYLYSDRWEGIVMKKNIKAFALFLAFFSISPIIYSDDDPVTSPSPIPAQIFVSPSMVTLRYAGDVRFRATAFDVNGNRIENWEPTEWRASAGIMYSDGWYVGNISGYHTIQAVHVYYRQGSGSTEPERVEVIGEASVNVGHPDPRDPR